MKTNPFWILVVVLLVIEMIINYFLNFVFIFEEKTDWTIVAFSIAGSIIAAAVLGFVLAAILAAIPFKKLKYNSKLLKILPIATSLVLIFVIAMDGYHLLLNNLYGTKNTNKFYSEIVIPSDVDCSSMHDGTFRSPQLEIIRSGNHQIQKNLLNGEISEFEIVWLNNCEYHLIPQTASDDKILVKIVEVTSDGYSCYVGGENEFNQPYFIEIKKIK